MENWLDSPEMEAFREAWRHADLVQGAEDQAWWDSLTMDERAQAFRQICKLIYKADITDKGSYRYAMYDIFNIDYGDGLKHYMQIHNLISRAVDDEQAAGAGSADDSSNDTNVQS
jgi:hypothetical protein